MFNPVSISFHVLSSSGPGSPMYLSSSSLKSDLVSSSMMCLAASDFVSHDQGVRLIISQRSVLNPFSYDGACKDRD